MFLTDRPIKSFEEDILGRSDFSKSLAHAILRHKFTESLVIGLYGGWGFGKTSILNMSLEFMESICQTEKENIPTIIRFNPWNFSEQNQLLFQFFRQLTISFRQENSPVELKAAGEKILELVKIFQHHLPLETAEQFMGLDDFATLRAKIDSILLDLDSKILIIIDDIDRLNGTEIKQIFQLVKTLADFPNTVYILSFNKHVILKTLEDSLKGCSGSDYLEDIIQVPFVVPAIPESKIHNLLYTEIEDLVIEEKDGFIEEYWKTIYNSGLRGFFKDIRAINRYLNVLRFDYELVKGEVNIVEFLAVSALQVFEPYVYDGIKNNKELFCYGKYLNKPLSAESLDKLSRDNFFNIIEKREKISEEELKNLLSWLFPKVTSLCGTSLPKSNISQYKIDPTIADAGNFETYFKSSILENKISSRKVIKVISSFKIADKFKEELFKLEDYEIDDFLSRLVNPDQYSILSKFMSNITIEEIRNLVTGLTAFGDKLYNDHLIEINKISNIIHYFIMKIDEYNDRFELLKLAINGTKDNLYITSLIVYNSIVNRAIINQEHIYELRELVRTKTETHEKLLKHENLALILINFKKLGYRGQVNYIIEKIKQNDEAFLHLVSSYLNKSERLKGTSIRADNIRILLPFAEIDSRIREISINTDLEKLEEHKKYVIQKVLNIIKSSRLAKLNGNK